MLNHITIMGRLTKDVELRRTNTGTAVASFTIACDRDFGQDGQKETDFVEIVAWRNTAEFAAKYFSKGRMAVVSGRLQIRSWTDKDGNKRKNAEVVAENIYFGDSKKEERAAEGVGPYETEGETIPQSAAPTAPFTQGSLGAVERAAGYRPSHYGFPEPGEFQPLTEPDEKLPF